jgi:GxxExxY protein
MSETDYAFEDETYAVIGAAIEVLSQLGHGIHEKPYENALAVELGLREICCQQQTHFDVNRRSRGFSRNLPGHRCSLPRLGTATTLSA